MAETEERERIAKRMARAGIASRRDAERMILFGRVTLNGELLTTPRSRRPGSGAITRNEG